MKILIRGAGDLATGIAAELWERGHQILMTDVAIPLTVRREVAFSRAVYEEHAVVEGIEAVLADNFEEAETIMATREGSAIPNTGIPGNIGGYTVERLLKASADGIMHPVARIGDVVKKGQIVARCGDEPVYARLHGIVRGMLQEGVPVKKGLKIGDVDARIEGKLCYTISDKARKIGNGVAEAIDLVYKTK